MALAPRCRCRTVQSRPLHLRCKVQLGASAPHLGACTIRSPVADKRILSQSTGKYALQFEIRCLRRVWTYDRDRQEILEEPHAILRSATKPAATKTCGRRLCAGRYFSRGKKRGVLGQMCSRRSYTTLHLTTPHQTHPRLSRAGKTTQWQAQGATSAQAHLPPPSPLPAMAATHAREQVAPLVGPVKAQKRPGAAAMAGS